MNYAPWDKELNLIALHWFIKNGKYLLARKSLINLKKYHPESPETVYAGVQFALAWKQVDHTKIKEIVVKKVNETLAEYPQTPSLLENYFEENTSKSLVGMFYQIKGLK